MHTRTKISFIKATVLVAALSLSCATLAEPNQCFVSEDDKKIFLALEASVFDQDKTKGWRRISERGCDEEAADLIKEYLLYSTAPMPLFGGRFTILRWHAGQLYAFAGKNDEAIRFFKASYSSNDEHHNKTWNEYVNATIAFMEKDKKELNAARQRLFVLIEDNSDPDDYARGNLIVVDSLKENFSESYKRAYTSD